MALDRRSIDREYLAMVLVLGVRPRALTLIVHYIYAVNSI
jgi:hypothetical protein